MCKLFTGDHKRPPLCNNKRYILANLTRSIPKYKIRRGRTLGHVEWNLRVINDFTRKRVLLLITTTRLIKSYKDYDLHEASQMTVASI